MCMISEHYFLAGECVSYRKEYQALVGEPVLSGQATQSHKHNIEY